MFTICFNGTAVSTDCADLDGLRRHYSHKGSITIVNGYATAENLPIKEGDEIFFIPKDRLPPQEALETMMCARHTPHVHDSVKKGTVAIAGLGGLGSNAAVYLARTGVGTLHLVDFDTVDASNLNRQSYSIGDLGQYKADALAAQIKQINPFITVKTDKVRVTEANAATLFAYDEIVCEAFDNPDAKTMLIHALLEQCPEKYIVSASGMAGYGHSNDIVTKKITDHFYICGDQQQAARPGRGLMAPRVAICAAHEANLIITLLVDVLAKTR